MKLSDLSSDDIKLVSRPEPMKLSDVSDEDLRAVDNSPAPSEEPTKGQAALAGMKAGVPFSNQLAGGTQGIMDLLGKLGIGTSVSDTNSKLAAQGFTDKGGAPLADQSTGDIYSEARDAERAQKSAAQAAHPLAYLGGNLIGGAAAAGPIMGAAGMAGRAIGGLAPQTAGTLSMLGTMARQAAPIKTAIAGGAATGAGVGALYGAGEGDALGGAKAGAIGGGLISGAGAGLGALRDLIARNAGKTTLGQQIGRSFEMGKEGQGILSQDNKLKITQNLNSQAQKLSDFIGDQAETAWKSKLKALQDSGQQFNLQTIKDLADQEINNAVGSAQLLPDQELAVRQTIQNALYKQIPDEVKKTVNSVIKTTKTRTREIEGQPVTTEDTTFKGKGMSPEELQAASEQIEPDQLQSVSSTVKQNPEMPDQPDTTHTQGLIPPPEAAPQELGEVSATEAAQRVKNIGNVGFDMTRPQVAPVLQRIAGKASGALKTAYPETEQFTDKISQLKQLSEELGGDPDKIKMLSTPNQDFAPAKAQVVDLVKNMTNVSDPKIVQNRETIKAMLDKIDPVYANKFFKDAQQAALDQSIAGEAGKTGLAYAGQTLKSLPLTGANAAGFGAKAISRVSNAASKLASWPQEKLQSASAALKSSNNPSSKRLGEMLDGIASGDPQKRGAMLFSISQNKDYRDMIDKSTPDVMEDDEKKKQTGGAPTQTGGLYGGN